MTSSIKGNIRKAMDTVFLMLAKITRTNLTTVGYYQKGILKYGDNHVTGEDFVMKKILKKYLPGEKLCFFDIGSNTGSYSASLAKIFPTSQIYAFEANPVAFEKIPEENIFENITFRNLGVGAKIGSCTMYDYTDDPGNEHASIHEDVLTDIHHSKKVKRIEIKMTTLDNFCHTNNIEKINFLKIDTEGSELDVLIGSKNMLSSGKIDVIQFEFNEMNVVSKVFLKDYYNRLHEYDIYRIDSTGLIPLPVYSTENEIFKYQNFLAIHKFLNTSP